MSRKTLAAGFIGLALLLVFVLAALSITASSKTYRTGWVVVRTVTLGATMGVDDVHQIRVPSGGDSFNAISVTPVGKTAAHQMSAGHLLDESDFTQGTGVEVPVSIKNAGDLHANDRVDIAAVIGGKLVLIARGIILTSPGVAQVSAQDEIYWLEVNASGTSLYAARSGGANVLAPAGGLSANDALTHLAQEAASGNSGSVPSPSPSP